MPTTYIIIQDLLFVYKCTPASLGISSVPVSQIHALFWTSNSQVWSPAICTNTKMSEVDLKSFFFFQSLNIFSYVHSQSTWYYT